MSKQTIFGKAIEQLRSLKKLTHTQQGKEIITFLGFVVLATGIWFILAINDNREDVVQIPIELTNLPEEAVESGFKCVFSLNKEGQQSQIFIKSGEGGLNSMLMINVCHSPDGNLDYAVVALIGGVFSHDEILSLMNF